MFSLLARSATLKRLASQYGMTPSGFARRFIAGETVHEAIEAARTLQGRGMLVTLDYLGESVSTLKAATAATREYVQLIETIVASGIERNISLKLTQLGLTIDRATCVDNLRRILEPATPPRLLRPHRHGELAVHAADDRGLRDAVAPRRSATSASRCSRACIAPSRTSGA